MHKILSSGSVHGVVANLLDYNIIVRKFKLQLLYYVYFWTNAPLEERYEPPLSPSYEGNGTTTVLLQSWLWH